MSRPASRQNDPVAPRFRNQRFGTDITNSRPKQSTFRRDSFDPVMNKKRGKGLSPLTFLLLVLAGVVAFFGAGNLQQINTWGDAATRWVHENNDSLVGAILGSGGTILMVLGGAFLLFIFLMWRNSVRRRASEE